MGEYSNGAACPFITVSHTLRSAQLKDKLQQTNIASKFECKAKDFHNEGSQRLEQDAQKV